jgi:hypothetical protein
LVLATAGGISTSRRSVARVEAINATSREIIETGLRRRIPVRGTEDEWDGLAKDLVRCSTASRIWLRRTGRSPITWRTTCRRN